VRSIKQTNKLGHWLFQLPFFLNKKNPTLKLDFFSKLIAKGKLPKANQL
tara:strand:+ start:3796 stop:3942 length:147 start_codon:yes stop_codon:yes gene_type:complete